MSAIHELAEEPFFIDVSGGRLFAFLHNAVAPARGTVVFCHALAEEKLWSHRVYVESAREFARAGYNVLRFDMRGEGDSSLDFEESSVQTRVEDTLAAIEAAERRFEPGRVVLIGHRMGGMIAAIAASRGTESVRAVAIWDPLPDGEVYFATLLRTNLATQMATSGRVTRTRDDLARAIAGGEIVYVDGYGLTPVLQNEISALKWPVLAEALSSASLIVEARSSNQTEPSSYLLDIRERFPSVELALAAEPPFWRETRQFHRRAPEFMRITLEWLDRLTS